MTESKKKGRKPIAMILSIVGGIVLAIIVAAGIFVYNNLNYDKSPMRAVERAGFIETQVTLPDGSVINYGEGGAGTPLLLIHGQCVSWEDYMEVLPDLSAHYHVYAVDCYGHGESSADATKYSAKAIGNDLIWFIENVIGEPCVVSGHSSGGLIAAWMAANSPDNILGTVLEDPPFFTTEEDRITEGFAYYDTFLPAHDFLSQSETDDYPLYYLKNNMWLNFFGDAKAGIIKYGESYRKKHPTEPIKFFFLPPSMTRTFLFLDDYDPQFAQAFYDGSWMFDYPHEETLSRIECPAVLIHTNWSYDDNGILLAAMNGDDAKKACGLIDGCEMITLDSGHDSHAEKPKEFIKIMVQFLERI